MGVGDDKGPGPASTARRNEHGASAKEGAARAEAVLPVPLRPAAVEWIAPSSAKQDPWTLFDGRATIGLQASSSEPLRVGVFLDAPTELAAVTVLGPADGTLTVLATEGDRAVPVESLRAVPVRAGPGEWKRVEAQRGVVAQKLVIEWASSAPLGPTEVGLWGYGLPKLETSDLALADRITAGAALGGTSTVATPTEARVPSLPNAITADPSATFHAQLAADPRSLARTFLVYELTGLGHFTEVVRQINGLQRRGGTPLTSPDGPPLDSHAGGLQVEEISPDWLRVGDNEIRFYPVPDPDGRQYTVRNVHIVGLGRPSVVEARMSDVQRGAAQPLAFDGKSQPHDVVFDVLQPSDGLLVVQALGAKGRSPVKVDLHGMAPGWHRIDASRLGAVDGVAVALTQEKRGGMRSRAEGALPLVSDVAVTASALPAAGDDAGIVATYPLHGECFDHRARVRGFVRSAEGSVAAFHANGASFDDAVTRDGSFELTVEEPAAEKGQRWTVALEAKLQDGSTLRRAVPMDRCIDQAEATAGGPVEDEGAPFAQVVRPDENTTIAYAGARLEVPEGAVDHDVRITVRPLVHDQVPKMDSRMVNITPDGRGFRFGPHGLKFKKPVKLTLPYDAAGISPGMHERHIFGFYFDETEKKWARVGRFGAAHGGALTSLTEHFTDFVNATLAMPDESGPQSFNPNEMNGIKVANPSNRVDLIAPPKANNAGSARLDYPIEVPPGRNGVEPELAVTYDSERKDGGWMGVGWDVSLSRIEVDTRFGVPVTSSTTPTQYDGNEVYGIDGQLLTAIDPPGTQNRRYQRRVEGPFEQITNNGAGAGSTWTVIDKNGRTFTYGEKDATTGIAAVLAARDPSGAITSPVGTWLLTSVEDTFGNRMVVHYTMECNCATSQVAPPPSTAFLSGVPWMQMYPASIDYTSNVNAGTDGHYHVTFGLDDGTHRRDQMSNARAGFLVLTTRRLNSVSVSLDAQPIRSYQFNYEDGAFEKTRLLSIQMFGTDNVTALEEHDFGYTPNPASDSNGVLQGFAAPATWGSTSVDSFGSNTDTQGGLSGYVGIGPIDCFPHVGLGGAFNGGSEQTTTAFTDVNGDGLPDLVGGSTASFNVPNPGFTSGTFGPGSQSVTLPNGGNVGASEHMSASLNAGAHLFGEFVGLGANANWSWTTEQQSFDDLNGDGFPDILNSGGAATFLNAGQPISVTSSSSAPISSGNLTDPSIAGQLQSAFYSTSVLVKWQAPLSGVITIGGMVALAPGSQNSVKASIIRYQEPPSVKTPVESFPWSRQINPGDAPCIPDGSNGCDSSPTTPVSFQVSQGDNVYFLVDPVGRTNDDLTNWSPTITYTSVCGSGGCKPLTQQQIQTTTDGFGLPAFVYSQPGDFRITDPQAGGWVASTDGTVVIAGTLTITNPTGALTLQLYQRSGDTGQVSKITQQTVPANQTGPVTLDQTWTTTVTQTDTLFLVANYTAANVDPGNAVWQPQVQYTQMCGTAGNRQTCRSVIQCSPPIANVSCLQQLPGDLPQADQTPTAAVIQPAEVSDTTMLTTTTSNLQSFTPPCSGLLTLQGTITKEQTQDGVLLVVSAGGRDLFKQEVNAPAIPTPVAEPPAPITLQVQANQALTFTTYFAQLSESIDQDAGPTVTWSPQLVCPGGTQTVSVSPVNTAVLAGPQTNPQQGFAGGFRGWSYGEWSTQYQPFMENEVGAVPSGVSSTSPGAPFFTRVIPHWEGIHRGATASPTLPASTSLQVNGPLWGGSGGDFYIAAGQWKPSRIGGVDPGDLGSTPGLSKSLSQTASFSASAGVSFIEAPNAPPFGVTDEQRELIDLNGDKRPDVIDSSGQAQLQICNTAPCDGTETDLSYSSPASFSNFSGSVRHTDNQNMQFGIGFGSTAAAIAQQAKASGTTQSVLSVLPSLAQGYGTSSVTQDELDINGDGLPDRVTTDGSGNFSVQLNFGHGFQPAITWPLGTWSSGFNSDPDIPSQTVSPSSFNPLSGVGPDVLGSIEQFFGATPSTDVIRWQDNVTDSLQIGYAGIGGGFAYSVARTLVDFVDVNGDGLPDRVLRQPGTDQIFVRLNLGSSFAPSQLWSLPQFSNIGGDFTKAINGTNDSLSFNETTTYDVGVGFPALIPIPPAVCLSIEISETISQGNGAAELSWKDIDGDGAVDHVLLMKGSGSVVAELNQTSKANLLTQVTRPLGGSFALEYQRQGNVARQTVAGSANLPSYQVDMPTNQWALSKVTVTDSPGHATGQPDIVETFSYGDPVTGIPSEFYDRTERESYGYRFVTTTRAGDGSRHVDVYDTSDYYHRGLIDATFEEDASGNLFTRTDYSYALTTGSPPSITGSFFPKENSRTTSFHEGTTSDPTQPGVTWTESRQWDNFGNLTDMTDSGDVGLADAATYHVTYDTTLAASRIFKAHEVTAKDGSGNLLRDRQATYDGRAALLTLTNFITGGTDPSSGNPYSSTPQTWQFTTDMFGNITQGVDPRGYTLAYLYDATVETFRTNISDIFGYSSAVLYDLRFGEPLLKTDVNGNQTAFSYDNFGRLLTVDAPVDVGTTGEHTIAINYSFPTTSGPAPFPAFATTAHKDVQHPGNPIVTSTFIDGLQRVIQTKKDLDKANGTGTTTGMTVSGALAFDGLGRVIAQGQPTFNTSVDPTVFVPPSMVNATVFGYDILDRTVSSQRPDGALTTSKYQFDTLAGTTRLATFVSDPNVNADINQHLSLPGSVRETFRGVRGNVLAAQETNRLDGSTPTTISTQYAYDALAELVQVTDAKGNQTTATYDTVGRMVALNSPDMGLTTYSFDLSNNLGAKQTAKLRAKSQTIRYQYQFNRLQQITYPVSPPVVYTYGSPSEAGETSFNRAGRVETEVSEAGTKSFEYDELGNISQQSWSLNSLRPPPVGPINETMTYSYDAFGRLLSMVFPGSDNEVVSYGYDHGGNVTSAVGVDNTGGVTNYLLSIGYDEFEQRDQVTSGNGVQTTYAYDPLTRRVTQINSAQRDPALVAAKLPARPMQRMQYSYDPVGNITQFSNGAPFDPSLGPQVRLGPSTQTFTYDDLYQLKTASGVYQEVSKNEFQYGLSFNYDAISNVVVKQQTSEIDKLSGGAKPLPVHNQTYTSTFTYAGPHPHAPTEVDDQLVAPPQTVPRRIDYDESGNQVAWTIGQPTSDARMVTFDEENRVTNVNDLGHNLSQVLYDGAGQRAVRLHLAGGEEEAAYFGSNLTVRDGDIPTRHVFAGTTRIATKVGNNGNQPPTTLYFHDDRLGSTNFMTDGVQELVDHQEYFPTGELWVDETEDPLHLNQPYLFTGKELDVETGLYYFGSRYYDPRLSMWISPDPVLDRYMHGSPANGVFTPLNLSLYTYTWNNPLVLRDPNGAWPTMQDVKDFGVRLGHRAAGFAYGFVEGYTPGGVLTTPFANKAFEGLTSREFEEGRGLGQITGGGVQAIQGGIEIGGGVACAVGTAGACTPITVGAAAVGTVQVASGVASVHQGLQTLQMAAHKKGARDGPRYEREPAPTGDKTPTPTMKDSDFGPKVADEVPQGVPKNWSKPQIEDAITDYKTSIASRKAEQQAYAAGGQGNEAQRVAHAQRITQEEAFLRSLEKALEK
jgi:RHS repeat-associated protein